MYNLDDSTSGLYDQQQLAVRCVISTCIILQFKVIILRRHSNHWELVPLVVSHVMCYKYRFELSLGGVLRYGDSKPNRQSRTLNDVPRETINGRG